MRAITATSLADAEEFEGFASPTVSVTPATAPTAPASVTAEQNGPGSALLRWTAPINNGGAAVTHYEYRAGSSR